MLLGGDAQDENLVALAGLLVGRPARVQDLRHHALARAPAGRLPDRDTARPLLGLVVLTAFLAAGSGVEGAMIGTIVGTAAAGIVGLVLLTGSYEPVVRPQARSARSSSAAATGRRS